jgi:CRISPR/Cas system-associated exonuclease Cas4 (RecB family)
MTLASLKILTWTPSRFAKWKECPAKVKYEDLLKLCPKCFKGRLSGGYNGEPVVCDTCDKPQPERAALDRGNRLDDALTVHVRPPTSVAATPEKLSAAGTEPVAHSEALVEAVRHPAIAKLVKKLRKKKGVLVQESIVLDSKWSRVGQFTKNAWARLKLDVLVLSPKIAEVIDWKSGNIDKKTQQIRERDEYHDSMRAYQAAVLSAYPQAQASATMAFLDAPPKLDNPFKSLPVLKRKDLSEAQRVIEKKLTPMLNDTIFAPRPGYYCNYCSYSKRNGGPCQF